MNVFQRTARRLGAIAALSAVMAPVMAQGPTDPLPLPPFDIEEFTERVRTDLGATDEAIAAFRTELEETASAVLAAENLLRGLDERFDAAVTAVEDADPQAALLLAGLATDDAADPHLRAYARFYLGRLFLDADDPEKAASMFADLLRNERRVTPLDAEAYFLFATSLAEIPDPRSAAGHFDNFLRLFPDAPERLRAVAVQRRAELQARESEPLHGLADDMRKIGRDIRRTETGKQVQTDQLEVVEQLEKIIEQLEQQQQQSGAPGGNDPQAPASNSALPGGNSEMGRLDQYRKTTDRWGSMSDRERREIEAKVEEKMPSHYRRWLQDYYRKLNQGN